MGVLGEMVILKGYDKGREVWAVAHTYGSGETAETFFCYLDPNADVLREYERAKNVFTNKGKEKRRDRRVFNDKARTDLYLQSGKRPRD